jgi:hypothetical protein
MIPTTLHRLLYRGFLRMGPYGFPPKGPRVAEEPYRITADGERALQEAVRAARKSKAVKDGLEDLA